MEKKIVFIAIIGKSGLFCQMCGKQGVIGSNCVFCGARKS